MRIIELYMQMIAYAALQKYPENMLSGDSKSDTVMYKVFNMLEQSKTELE